MDQDADRLLSGEAWREWCDRLKAAGDRILESHFPTDERTRAEGYRALTRRLAYAMRSEIEAADRAFPNFARASDPHSQWGSPNPDCVELRAVIDPNETYKIWADIDGLFQAIFCQLEDNGKPGGSAVSGERHLDTFEIGEDGFLEIILSPDDHSKNWIASHPDASMLTVRIIVSDWENHAAPTFHIERVGAEGERPPPPTAGEVARGLERVVDWIDASTTDWQVAMQDAARTMAPNQPGPIEEEIGGVHSIVEGRCLWDLAEDQALILTWEVPIAQYCNLSAHTVTWLESGDFARRQTSLSGDQIYLDGDGLARLVLSARDPGVPNWIDTEGREEGLLAYRWAWAETMPTPVAQRIKVDEVFGQMPDDHPVVTDEERRGQLSLRREALWNRFV
jgi:hypothetical protein